MKRRVDFIKEIKYCILGELRLLLKMSSDELLEKLFSRFNKDDILDLRTYWNKTVYSDRLKETYTLFKEGKLPLPKEVYKTSSGSLGYSYIAYTSQLTFPERPKKRARKQKTSTEVILEPESGINSNIVSLLRNIQLC